MAGTRRVIYVAHPMSPNGTELDEAAKPISWSRTSDTLFSLALRANLDRAMRWLAWLRRSFAETTFIAPWIATVTSLGGDDSHALREAGLVDDCAVVERCDGIVLCGGRISSGMRRESEARRFPDHWVCDLTGLGAEPPGQASSGVTFAAYVDAHRREALERMIEP